MIDSNFNPIIGLILTKSPVVNLSKLIVFQSHYRSDFNKSADIMMRYGWVDFNPIIGLILTLTDYGVKVVNVYFNPIIGLILTSYSILML